MMNIQWIRTRSIEAGIYEKANERGVGVPIKKYQHRFLYLLRVFSLLMLALTIYSFIDSIYTYREAQSIVQQIENLYRNCTDCSKGERAKAALEDHYTLEDAKIRISQGVFYIFSMLLTLLIYWYFTRGKLYLCSEGLLLLEEKTEEAIRWDEIVEMNWHQDHRAIFFLTRSDSSEFSTPQNMMRKELREAIEREVFARLLPPLLERYTSGEVLKFKDLRISKEGVWLVRQKIRWGEIEDVQADRKYVVLKLGGKWKKLKWENVFACETSNVPICVELIKRVKAQEK